jgi:SAM-dependent methyltransferase
VTDSGKARHRPTERFTDRVESYRRYRPGYPAAALAWIAVRTDLGPGSVVADVGAGTGILTASLLELGCAVRAVEPNDAMRAALVEALGDRADLTVHAGRAEDTGLPDDSVDLVAAAQAFHWFDAERSRAEFRRILRPPRHVALLWNDRRLAGDPFMVGYEEVLAGHCPEYRTVRWNDATEDDIEPFFAPDTMEIHVEDNSQWLDWDALHGRLLSSSYVPRPGTPAHDALMKDMRALFDARAREGLVHMLYDTRVYLGRV